MLDNTSLCVSILCMLEAVHAQYKFMCVYTVYARGCSRTIQVYVHLSAVECIRTMNSIPNHRLGIQSYHTLVLEAGGPRGHVPPQIFWRGGTRGTML